MDYYLPILFESFIVSEAMVKNEKERDLILIDKERFFTCGLGNYMVPCMNQTTHTMTKRHTMKFKLGER